MKMLRDSLKQESSSSLAAGMPMPTSSSSRSQLLTPKPEQNATTVATNDNVQAGQQENMANDDELGKKKMKEVVDVAATEEPIKALRSPQKQQQQMPITTKEPTKKGFQHSDDVPISQEVGKYFEIFASEPFFRFLSWVQGRRFRLSEGYPCPGFNQKKF